MDNRLALAICQGYVKTYTPAESAEAWQTIIDSGDVWRNVHKEGHSLGREAGRRIHSGTNTDKKSIANHYQPGRDTDAVTEHNAKAIGNLAGAVEQGSKVIGHLAHDIEDEHLVKATQSLDAHLTPE